MARTKEFETVDLQIQPVLGTNASAAEPNESPHDTVREQFHFAGEDQVIAYLTNGETGDSGGGADASNIRVSVIEPTDDADGLTFPPESPGRPRPGMQ